MLTPARRATLNRMLADATPVRLSSELRPPLETGVKAPLPDE